MTTIAYQLEGKRTFALEGSIFVAGAAVQWLRDGMKVIESSAAAGGMAQAADPAQSVVLVPAFVGLGAPYWDPDCRGALFGLTRNTGPNELAKAALDSVCFQTWDLLKAMRGDWPAAAETIVRVDGGMAASDWTMQRLADILDVPVDRPTVLETTALGAAYLAGLQSGFYPAPDRFAERWALDRRFTPALAAPARQAQIAAWHDAVRPHLVGWRTRPNLSLMPKLLIIAGIVLIAVGVAWLAGERLGLGRLPGDILIERENVRIYIPLMTSLIVSVVLSLAFWFFSR